MTRTDDRIARMRLLEYVTSVGLVVGGEHGMWWCTPYLHYVEGMMSGGFYSWFIFRPDKDKISEDYLKYSIRHYYRIPLSVQNGNLERKDAVIATTKPISFILLISNFLLCNAFGQEGW